MIVAIGKRHKLLIRIYFFTLIFMLLIVSLVPILIRHGITLRRNFIIDEEILESGLIVLLFGISYLIWLGFRRRLASYQRAMERSGAEQSKLIARLVEDFKYIGSVNVVFNETMTVLCGLSHYPRTRKELKRYFHQMAAKISTIADAPWTILRVIHRSTGRTITEYTFERVKGLLPQATLGNRAILDGRCEEGLKTVCSVQKNLDLHTVLILPVVQLRAEEKLLITAMVNQMEMIFLLFNEDRRQNLRWTDLEKEEQLT
ncbi:MAG: hypothetical protein M0036_13450 [Desulfobacteraceae bacterium]|nr:hypothetical protein [Desulfobacteraceae bacterium]